MKFKNDEERDNIVSLAICGYVGEICPHCKKEFSSVQDIKNKSPIYVGRLPNGKMNPNGRICCNSCFYDYSKKEISKIKEKSNKLRLPPPIDLTKETGEVIGAVYDAVGSIRRCKTVEDFGEYRFVLVKKFDYKIKDLKIKCNLK